MGAKKRLLILTDTTNTQVNGVTRSISELYKHIPDNGEIFVISADDFTSIPFPGYKEIRLSLPFPRSLRQKINTIRPDYIHIETEGPIGVV